MFNFQLLRSTRPCRPCPRLVSSPASFSGPAGPVTPVTTRHIAPSITLRQPHRDETDMMRERGRPRTIVLFFPFLFSPQKAKDQYCELYHSRGLDVISIHGDLKYFMWPPSGKRLARSVLDYLVSNETPLNVDHFFIHGMSIGCYIWALMLMEVLENQQKYGQVMKKVSGQVFDSITVGSVDNMTTGIANMAGRGLTFYLVKYSAELFLALTKKSTKDIHNESIAVFKSMPVTAPVLLYYCRNDPMCRVEHMEEMVERWRTEARFDVHVKCWERSIHGAHMKEHPEQYTKTLESFLQHVGLQPIKAKL